mmetsp:Transcript_37756/g.72332  ORF Transcript_37756/g.72332 Transcript_37756/m.72332 type:complete len:266 (+) Transcript_37756:1055-1852(+)
MRAASREVASQLVVQSCPARGEGAPLACVAALGPQPTAQSPAASPPPAIFSSTKSQSNRFPSHCQKRSCAPCSAPEPAWEWCPPGPLLAQAGPTGTTGSGSCGKWPAPSDVHPGPTPSPSPWRVRPNQAQAVMTDAEVDPPGRGASSPWTPCAAQARRPAALSCWSCAVSEQSCSVGQTTPPGPGSRPCDCWRHSASAWRTLGVGRRQMRGERALGWRARPSGALLSPPPYGECQSIQTSPLWGMRAVCRGPTLLVAFSRWVPPG